MKICFTCNQELPGERFYKDKRNKDGLYSSCITCYNRKRAGKVSNVSKEAQPTNQEQQTYVIDAYNSMTREELQNWFTTTQTISINTYRELMKITKGICSKCKDKYPLLEPVVKNNNIKLVCKTCLTKSKQVYKPDVMDEIRFCYIDQDG